MPIKTLQDEQPSLNLTPMIDIVFLLVIFFMVGTKFAEMERTIQLNVPQVGQAGDVAPKNERKIVNVLSSGVIIMDNEELSADALTTRLRQAIAANPGVSVVVRGDAQGTLQNVATVLTACKQAGVNEMGISVKLAQRNRSLH